ncbi:MAG: PHP domain-containing protein [Candidatus Riflebacteria bacterium]|nr:PHP domain-containing protein [Candidatus Riflebacteria bacterium]
MGKADLHSHSTCSDGVLKPAELVEAARRARLSVLSITDHDSVDAYRDLPSTGPGLELVVGVEISVFHDGGEIHVLGYFVDPACPELASLLARMSRARQERAARILDRLAAAGIELPPERRAPLLANPHVGRPHIARALVEAGAVASRREAFRRFLVPGAPGYERRSDLPSGHEALKIIATAGGVGVWAHPGTDCMIDSGPLTELERSGLRGLEAFHPSHTRGEMESLALFARRRGLIVTGGSDFHGDGREGAKVGDCAVDAAVVKRLEVHRGRMPS